MSNKSTFIQIRVTPDEKRLLFQLAGSVAVTTGSRPSMSAVLVDLAVREARHRGLGPARPDAHVREVAIDANR